MRYSILMLLIGLAGCAGSVSGEGRGGAAGLQVADTALSNGVPSMALQVSASMLATNPNDTAALLRHARANLMLGKTADAESDYRHALQINPNLSEAGMELGKIALPSNPQAAEKLFAAIVKHDPTNLKALNDLGVARDLQGHHADAQTAYRQALAINPTLTSAQQNLGLSLAISGKAAEGVNLLDKLTGQGDDNRRARDDLAVALALNGRTGEADKVLREELSDTDASRALAGYRDLAAGAATP
jgi:Flp pilus assembly protein TadD